MGPAVAAHDEAEDADDQQDAGEHDEKAEVGGSENISATVIAGLIPGSTLTAVPSATPSSPNIRLTGVGVSANPFSSSIIRRPPLQLSAKQLEAERVSGARTASRAP
jgi:hypothetical protein